MKKFILILGVAIALAVSPTYAQKAKQMLSSYGLTSDTVANTATSYLQTYIPGNADFVSFQINATEISGTTAGTITLQGSLDGTNFKALVTLDSQTALATATATDVASQTFIWRLTGNPCPYYRISWTGSGTMSDSFTAYAWPNR